MDKNQQGFTLLELKIVIAIIGIIAAIAIAAYGHFTSRAQFSEAMVLLGGLRGPAAEFYHSHGTLPTLGQITRRTQGKYGSLSEADSGQHGYTYTFSGTGLAGLLTSGSVTFTYVDHNWHCEHNGINRASITRPCDEMN